MNKIIYTLLTIITFSCISINANAIEIVGEPSCGEWVDYKEQNKQNGMSHRINQHWLLGFLSGYAVCSNKDFLQGTDNESIFLWVDNYCRTNPLKHISSAASELYIELVKQKGL